MNCCFIHFFGVGWGGTITSLQLRSLLDIRALILNMASFQMGWVGWVGWGGVGWGGKNVLAAAFPARHTCSHSQHGIVFRCGGVGWGGGWDNNVLAAAFPARHTCSHTQHGIVSDGVGWGGVGQ